MSTTTPHLILTREQALGLLAEVVSIPARDETIVLLRDACGVCRLTMVVTDTVDPDQVIGVLTTVIGLLPWASGFDLVLASMRCDQPLTFLDAERWEELDARATESCVDLVEWFVLTPDWLDGAPAHAPRALVGEPCRWG